MKAAAEAVAQFNEQIIGIPKRDISPMPVSEANHLGKCLREEANEFLTAQDEEDVVKCTDALIDSIYFALGGLYKMGLTPDQVNRTFYAVHSANMEKRGGKVASRAVDGAGDAVKPEGWIPPEERIGQILFGA